MSQRLSLTDIVPRGSKHPIIGRKERIAARRVRCFELRKMGYIYDQIAEIMQDEGYEKYNVSMVCKDLKAGLNSLLLQQKAASEDIRQLEVQRLDSMLVILNKQFFGTPDPDEEGKWLIPPDTSQTSNIMKLMDRRAKLLGLDAPDTTFLGMQITHETITRNYNQTQNIIDSPASTRRMSEILLRLNEKSSVV